MIAMTPAIGRPFLKAEYTAGAGHNIIISHSLWMRSFGGRTSAVGESVRARANDGGGGEELFTIVGVMPAHLRMAVGATPSQILQLVVGEAFRPLAFGLLGGVAIAVVAAPFARSLVYGMAPTNPVTMVAVALGILTLGTLASLLPARRATNIDPLIALRG